MLTRIQKKQIIKDGLETVRSNRSLIFIDFSGVKNQDLQSLRHQIKSAGSRMQVIKKKLLRIVFGGLNLNFNPEDFKTQVATVFSPMAIYDIASFFAKSETIKILGGFDLVNKQFVPAETVIVFSKLPSREVLLGQLAATIASPIRAFLYILNERSKKIA